MHIESTGVEIIYEEFTIDSEIPADDDTSGFSVRFRLNIDDDDLTKAQELAAASKRLIDSCIEIVKAAPVTVLLEGKVLTLTFSIEVENAFARLKSVV